MQPPLDPIVTFTLKRILSRGVSQPLEGFDPTSRPLDIMIQ